MKIYYPNVKSYNADILTNFSNRMDFDLLIIGR